MILRGIGARRLLCITIFLLTLLVVSGTVVAVGFSRLTDVSQGSAGALVLLGLVAVATQSIESVRRREHDLALARLRGRRGIRLLVFAVAEPCLVVLGGAVAGVAAGWLVARVVVQAWLPSGTTFSLGSDEWKGAGAVTLATLLIVVASSWRTLRTPLLDQLAGGRRPGAASTLGLFLQLVLVLGALVAIYQAHHADKARVDWVTLVSPAVIGLAAGQVLIWLLLALLAVAVPRSRGARVGWFLTLRRLFRRADSLALIRIVVAAGVVFAVAASASTAAQSWREERAKLQVGGPVSYPVAGGALAAYAAAQQADPQGHWLLPVASYTTDGDGGLRRVFVSAPRWGNVVGDFYAGTSTAALTRVLATLPPSPQVIYAQGTSLTATVTTASFQHAQDVSLTFQYVDDEGNVTIAHLRFQAADGAPAGPGLTRFTRSVADCTLSCTVSEVDVNGFTHGVLQLTDVTLAGEHLLSPASGISLASSSPGELTISRAGAGVDLEMPLERGGFTKTLAKFRSELSQPAVATSGIAYQTSDGLPTVEGVDGTPHQFHLVAKMPVLPYVGTRGTILDLGGVLRGASGSIPDTAAVVIARSNTPASVLAALRATGGVGPPTTYLKYLTRLDESPRAQGTRLYVLIAVFAALIALLSLASTVSQQTLERRNEAASLRSVGIPARLINGAYRREALLLAVATAVGTSIAAWTSCRALLSALPLVSGWPFAPALDVAPRLGWISVAAVAAGIAVAVVSYLAFRRVARAAPPRLLREDLT